MKMDGDFEEVKSDNTEGVEETKEVITEPESNVSEKEVDTSDVIDADEDFETLEKTLEAQKEKLLQPEVAEKKEEEDFENDIIKEEDVKGKTLQPDVSGKTEQKLNKHVVKITKEYIDKQPEEHREFLQAVLGKKEYTLSDEGLLKNYINSQIKIQDDAAKLEQLKTEKKVPEFSSEDLDQVTILTNKAVERELRAKYPDMPDITDTESMREWRLYKQSEDPDFDWEFRGSKDKLLKDYRSEAENEVHLKNNWQKIAQLQTEKEFGEFESFVKSKGLSLEEIGFDNTDNSMVRSILYKGNKANPDVIQLYNGEIPVVLTGRVLENLKNRFFDKILEQKELIARQSSFDKKEALKPNPSLSGGPAGKINVNDKQRVKDRLIDMDEDFDLLDETIKLQKDSFTRMGTSIS